MIKKILIAMFVLVVLISFVSAENNTSTVIIQNQTLPNYFYPGYGQDPSLAPSWQQGHCNESSMDFIVMTTPDACENVPVRSDVLEENEVPVFCKLTAIKINPLIQVPYIKNIVPIVENKSEQIYDVAFFPSKTAYSYYDYSQGSSKNNELTGSPTMNDIGYLMIRLKREPVESEMPDSVSVDLTAKITYDVAKSFGIHENTLVLKKMTDEEWRRNYKQYQFWQGKGYLRLLELEGTSKAKIALYTNPNSAPFFTQVMGEGDKTQEIKLPYYYCDAGPQIQVEKISKPETRARMIVNGNELLLTQNDEILDSRCHVSQIDPSEYSYSGRVAISCMGQVGEGSNILSLNEVRAKLGVGGEDKTYSIGEKIDSEGKYYYLGFAGREYERTEGALYSTDYIVVYGGLTDENGNKKEINEQRRQRVSTILSEIDRKTRSDGESIVELSNSQLTGKFRDKDKTLVEKIGELTIISRAASKKGIKVIKVEGPVDAKYPDEQEKAYKEAIQQYREVAYSYTNIRDVEREYYGIIALEKAADLAKFFDKGDDQMSLLLEILDRYSDSTDATIMGKLDEIRLRISKIAGTGGKSTTVLKTNQGSYYIQLLSVERPGANTLVARVEEEGIRQDYTLNSRVNGWFVKDISERSMTFEKIAGSEERTVVVGKIIYLPNKEGDENIDVEIKLLDTEINLEATVTLIPFESNRFTEANFSVDIGISKRAIQLSPEKINSLVDRLDGMISALNKVSDVLNKTTTLWQKACFVGGTALWLKNVVTGITGGTTARRKVMGKWGSLCGNEEYRKEAAYEEFGENRDISVSTCYQLKENEINQDVETYKRASKKVEEYVNKIKEHDKVISKGGLLGLSQFVDEDEFMKAAQEEFPDELKSIKVKDANGEELQISQLAERLEELYEGGKIYRGHLSETILDLYVLKECRESSNPDIFTSSAICNQSEQTISASLASIKQYLEGPTRRRLLENAEESGDPLYTIREGIESSYASISLGKVSQIERPVWEAEKLCNEGSKENPVPYTISSTIKGQTILRLEDTGDGMYKIIKAYTFKQKLDGSWDINKDNNEECIAITEIEKELGIENSVIVPIDPKSCGNNRILDPEIKFWQSGHYEGTIALMPIIRVSGWYLATQSYTGFENELVAFKTNGDLNSFWICNVGPDGKVDFDFNYGPKGDDAACCTKISLPVLSGEDILIPPLENPSQVIENAKSCVRKAKEEYDKGKKKIDTGKCGTYTLGAPPTNVPSVQCEEFMSPTDCRIMYNLCDPVICPASRCNFGGRYPTTNVQREGIIGSLLLCAPNFDNGRGVLVPVCLTGLNQGVHDFTKILEAYQACLKENLESGKTVGVCDDWHSIYVCDFFWRQLNPIIKFGLPAIVDPFLGGGEYSAFSESWQNAMDSLNYFTESYAKQKISAFKQRVTDQVGTKVCDKFVSVVFPSPGEFLDEISKPELYANAFATKYEVPNTGPTPESHYKIHYMISSGDQGVYYSVYLRNPPAAGYYNLPEQYFVPGATGYLPAGQVVDMTPDFMAGSGYKEICVRLNSEEKCDFGTVSWNFAIEELQNIYLEHQATRPITSQTECESGTPSIIPTATLNLQAMLEEGISPAIYKRGIQRRCASKNPGEGTQETNRFKRIGYCGNPDIGCWLDMDSVNNSISDLKIKQDVIDYAEKEDIAQAIDKLGLDDWKTTERKLAPIEANISVLEGVFKEIDAELRANLDDDISDEDKDKLKEKILEKAAPQLRILKDLIIDTRKIIDKAYDTEMKARAEYDLARLLDLKAKFTGAWDIFEKGLAKLKLTCVDYYKGVWMTPENGKCPGGYIDIKEATAKELADYEEGKVCCQKEGEYRSSLESENRVFDVWPSKTSYISAGIKFPLAKNYLFLENPLIEKANVQEVFSVWDGVITEIKHPSWTNILPTATTRVTIQYAENLYAEYRVPRPAIQPTPPNFLRGRIRSPSLVRGLQVGQVLSRGDKIAESDQDLLFFLYTDENPNRRVNPLCFFTDHNVNKFKEKNIEKWGGVYVSNVLWDEIERIKGDPPDIISRLISILGGTSQEDAIENLADVLGSIPTDAECEEQWLRVGEFFKGAPVLYFEWPTDHGEITKYFGKEVTTITPPAPPVGEPIRSYERNGNIWYVWRTEDFTNLVKELAQDEAIAQGIVAIATIEQSGGAGLLDFPETNAWGVMVVPGGTRSNAFGWGSNYVGWLSQDGYFEEREGSTGVIKKFVEFNGLSSGIEFMEEVWGRRSASGGVTAGGDGDKFAEVYIERWFSSSWKDDKTDSRYIQKKADLMRIWQGLNQYFD
ncbi:MAG: hypothetical protein JSW08_01080 [archaeon]|nr:MAG: hypothetical protein JSW08_01080 [archaeon]